MAMTKAEKARYEQMEEARDMARALRWPEYAEPAPMTADEIKANATLEAKTSWGGANCVCEAWRVISYQGGTVTKIYTDGHMVVSDLTSGSWSRDVGPLYRTREDALRVLRIRKTADYASHLATIDRLIAQGSAP